MLNKNGDSEALKYLGLLIGLLRTPKEARGLVGPVTQPSEMTIIGNRYLSASGVDASTRRLHEDGRGLLWNAYYMGDWSAMFVLARRTLDGDGLELDVDGGLSLLQEAARAGDPDALAWWMEDPDHKLLSADGCAKDLIEGRKWLRMAAELDGGQSTVALATRLLDGRGFDRDVEEGRMLLRLSAEAGSPEASYELALRTFSGRDFDKNIREGRRWLCRAAYAGYVPAMEQLALRIMNAEGEELFEKMAAEGSSWYSKATDASLKGFDEVRHADANDRFGEMVLGGDGIQRDVKKGMEWLLERVEAHVPRAMCVFGLRLLIRGSVNRWVPV